MNPRKAAAIMAAFRKAESLNEKGMDCLYERGKCCPCGHTGSDGIVIDGKPAACSCGQCPRYRCLSCNHPGKTEFCVAMTQYLIEEETA